MKKKSTGPWKNHPTH